MSRVRRLAINAADHLIGKKRWVAAASILENYLSSLPEGPPDPDVLRRLGKVRLAQGQPKAAAELFKKALTGYSNAAAQSRTETQPERPLVRTD